MQNELIASWRALNDLANLTALINAVRTMVSRMSKTQQVSIGIAVFVHEAASEHSVFIQMLRPTLKIVC